MKKNNYRIIQIGQEIKKCIAFILKKNINDPRISLNISILDVLVSADCSLAKVFFSLLREKEVKDIIKILNHASSYIRKKLSQYLYLRVVPVLNFIYDDSFLKGIAISKIINHALIIDSNCKIIKHRNII
ncbi:30S ribosome-binding factor [Buchnera aphidicola (Eriosoma lanigerum)]|uniref:30S ribosome-binding factor RbfA n=1 Tax=Buchnera aphidicola TaxID=9 RepID=UPI003464142B